jgi:hypothetical protein
MSTKPKGSDPVEVPPNWNDLPQEEQDAFIDKLIEGWVPRD